ncbi:hypothetical protein QP938_02380 [Porticoccaceae bacterium LTM1]|nr:hypothetical protein QP938_02380 [Porticoccaceae bacterium LTM1]
MIRTASALLTIILAVSSHSEDTLFSDEPSLKSPFALEYIEIIDRLSDQQGAFYEGLHDPLIRLGNLQLEEGYPLEALKTFKRARHISKINHGIHSFSQAESMRGILQVLLLTGESELYEILKLHLDSLYQTTLQNPKVADLPALVSGSEWHLNKYKNDLLQFSSDDLVDSVKLSKAALTLLTEQFGPSDQRLEKPLRLLMECQYYLAKHQQTRVSYTSGRFQAGTQSSIKRHYQQGLEAARRLVALFKATGEPRAIALALLDLGDYMQVFSQHVNAHKVYSEAWQLLSSNGEYELLAESFSKPVLLPEFDEDLYSGIPKALAKVRLDIDGSGKTSNIKVVETFPAANRQVANLAKELADNSVFRPLFADGEAVSVQQHEFNVLFPN